MDANRFLPMIALGLLATALVPTGHAAVPMVTDQVVINEVLYDPLEGNESVEIYNPTDAPVNLTGWSLSDGDYCPSWQPDVRTLAGTVDAGGYLVVELPNAYGGFTCNNLATADDLALLDPEGSLVDDVSWGDGEHVAEDGESLQRDLIVSREGGVSDDDLGTVTWTAGNPTLGEANVHAG